MGILDRDDIRRFERDGMLLLTGAIPAEHMARMIELIWVRLREVGVLREEPATWRMVSSAAMRGIKMDPGFADLGSPRLHGAINDLVGAGRWSAPASWGMFCLTAPRLGPSWEPRADGWHTDCNPWNDQRAAHFILSHVGETPPGGGGTLLLAGSHRRLARMAEGLPDDRAARRRLHRSFHQDSPWLRQLMGLDPSPLPRSRFMTEASPPDAHGVRLRVIETSGQPGDAWLCHATIMHVGGDNRTGRMRMMRIRVLNLLLNLLDGQGRDDPNSDTPLARRLRPEPRPA